MANPKAKAAVGTMAAAAERALRDELDGLARKREQLRTPKRQSEGTMPESRDSLFTRMNNDDDKRSPRNDRRGNVGSTSYSGDRRGGRQGLSETRAPRDGNQRRQSDGQRDRGSNQSHPQRLQSSVAKPSANEASSGDRDDAPSAEHRDGQTERRRVVAPHTGTEGLARSRRMFGALMGHLGKAKAMIEKDSSLIKKQTSKQQEAEQKEKEQSKALEAKVKRETATSKLETLIASAEIEMKEKLARTKLQHLQQSRTGASIAGFILTVSSPPLYYLPKKHTKETEDLVAASQESYEAKQKLSQRDHEDKLRDIEAEYQARIDKYKSQLEELRVDNDHEGRDGYDEKSALKPTEDESKAKDDEAMSDRDEKVVKKDEQRSSPTRPRQHSEPAAGDVKDAPVKRKRDDTSVSVSKKTRVEDTSQVADTEMSDEPSQGTTEPSQDEPVQAQKEPSAEASSPATKQETTSEALPFVPVDRPASPTSKVEEASVTTPQKQKKKDLNQLRVTDLREELKKRGLDTKGVKATLVKRLEDAMNNE